MKDEQLRILADQNTHLLGNLDKVEEDANNIQMEKLAVEEENRSLRDLNFELQVHEGHIICCQRQSLLCGPQISLRRRLLTSSLFATHTPLSPNLLLLVALFLARL